MSVMNVFSLLGGLSLFLFGMKIMGEGLERTAGNRLKNILNIVTHNRVLAVLAGMGITGGDPVLLGHHGNGGGLCERGAAVPDPGGGRHHGRQHRHHGHPP